MSKRAKKSPRKSNGAILASLQIDRRLSRGTDSEVWIIDGTKVDGKRVFGVGELAIMQDAENDYTHLIGGSRTNTRCTSTAT